jgi:glycosyltransferase involved in cell wall biosynthesis
VAIPYRTIALYPALRQAAVESSSRDWMTRLRLLFLSKRHPQQRDLMERPYGRFHHLPAALAALGHEVRVQLCSHHRLPDMRRRFVGVEWASNDLRTSWPLNFYRELNQNAIAFRPDWIIGVSDTYYGCMAHRLSRSTGARFAIDAYDNFEAYMPWNLPLHALWRRSVRAADLVTAAGPQLAHKLQSLRSSGHPVEVLPMSADPEFVPLDKATCRRTLGLPPDVPLIGYVGSWSRGRGMEILLDAFRAARAIRPEIMLLLSGHPPDEALREPGVISPGYISDNKLPALINSLDVACVTTADTSFGRFSYPAKLCEAMACGVPVLATATDPVRWMLGGRGEHLTPVGDAKAFSEHLIDLLDRPRADYGSRPTWPEQAQRLHLLLRSFAPHERVSDRALRRVPE